MSTIVIRALVDHWDAGVSGWVPAGYTIAVGVPILVIAAAIWWPHDRD
ncbi:hypothetical protein [Nocardia cyriacigeorgica]|jgi:hypothetical protein|nr:hypothetical protein [Nocardia cyriacigeorgica]MBF6325714.1 hypothetical protein [Nocardia cyriacigeorgica]MBF6495850.1 hypothetical protein [Nocardia cyriacigeorgica]